MKALRLSFTFLKRVLKLLGFAVIYGDHLPWNQLRNMRIFCLEEGPKQSAKASTSNVSNTCCHQAIHNRFRPIATPAECILHTFSLYLMMQRQSTHLLQVIHTIRNSFPSQVSFDLICSLTTRVSTQSMSSVFLTVL